MSSERNERPTAPPLCANNCGFYGSPANRNLCSKCYREFLKAEAAQEEETAKTLRRSLPADNTSPPTCDPNSSTETATTAARPDVATDSVPTASDASAARPSAEPRGKESERKGEARDLNAPLAGDSAQSDASATLPAVETQTAPTESVDAVSEKKTPKASRCRQCNRKIGLLGFQCRCGDFFCGEHRYADAHCCDFDYKTFEREQLKKQNNKVVADKLQKL